MASNKEPLIRRNASHERELPPNASPLASKVEDSSLRATSSMEATDASSSHQLHDDSSHLPRVLYIDVDDDLPHILDRVEEHATPAILVLPEGARGIRGTIAARLLKRRADAAGILVLVVTTDKLLISGLQSVGIRTVSTVGESRRYLSESFPLQQSDPLATIAWDEDTDNSSSGTLRNKESSSLDFALATEHLSSSLPMSRSHGETLLAEHSAAVSVATVPLRRTSPYRIGKRWLVGGLIGSMVLLLSIGIWLLFFPRATLTIVYTIRSFDRTYTVPIGPGSHAIPLYHTHLDATATRVIQGTGKKQVPDGVASGTIALANQLDGVIHVPAGTRVGTVDGIQFLVDEDVMVPGAVHSFSGTTNGQATVGIHAMLPGPAGNVADHTITSIEGRLSGTLLVANPTTLSGGTVKTVYSLTSDDTHQAIAQMIQDLSQQEIASLNQRYNQSPIRIIGKTQVFSPTIVQFTQNGRPYARISQKVRTPMDYIHNEDVEAVATQSRSTDLHGRNQQIVPGSVHLQITTKRQKDVLVAVIHDHAQTAPLIDSANLRALLVGRSLDGARQLLDGSAKNGGWTYTLHLSPDFAHRLPQASGLISINVRRAS